MSSPSANAKNYLTVFDTYEQIQMQSENIKALLSEVQICEERRWKPGPPEHKLSISVH